MRILMEPKPYDLWREDEPSQRVKDLVSAFAENPRLPKMLRQKEILYTIDQGVQDGIFVALLTRPDKSIKTWWRTPIDETARKEPALEVFLPDKANLSELHPNILAPGVLPGLWTGDAVTVADVIEPMSRRRWRRSCGHGQKLGCARKPDGPPRRARSRKMPPTWRSRDKEAR
jgi:hypothetical protein